MQWELLTPAAAVVAGPRSAVGVLRGRPESGTRISAADRVTAEQSGRVRVGGFSEGGASPNRANDRATAKHRVSG